MKRLPMTTLTTLGLLLSLALLSGGAGLAAPASETAATPPAADETRAAPWPVAAAGITVFKDPVTGRLLPAPAAELKRLLSADLEQALSMSQEGLVETIAPGGGMMVDLQGRFRSLTWATTAAGGAATVHCDQNAAAQSPQPRKE